MTTVSENVLRKWPGVPALYGWLELTRRGRWLIRGEPISNPRLCAMIARHYRVDHGGRWFFQNGPQRGYVALEYTPRVFRLQPDGTLVDHARQPVDSARALYFDEHGAAVLATAAGAGVIDGADLDWVLQRLRGAQAPLTEAALSDGADTGLVLAAFGAHLPVARCNDARLPAHLGFVRMPQPEN